MVNKGPLFTVSLVPNRHDRTKKVIQIDRARPSIPIEEYQKPRSKKLSELRHLIIFTVTVVLGADTNTTIAKVDEMLRFEGQLANVSLLDDLFQPGPVFNTSLLYFQHMVPQFDWIGYFNELFKPLWIPKSEILYPKTLVYLRRALRIIQNTPKSVLANYMVWYVLRSEVKWLSVKYYEAMKGIKVPKQIRFHSCVYSSETSFGDLLMVAYINDNHTQLVRSKNMAKIMANEEIQAFGENVKELTWLDNAAKSEAIQKINAMAIHVAFPDYMLNSTKLAILFEKYRGLNITAETYYKNKVSIKKRLRQHEIKDFRKPIDSALWKFPPPQALTWYFVDSNSLYVSEEYVRPPLFYHNEFLRAYNFGIFGSTAGHLATKALSADGKYFDKDRKRRNWWSQQSHQEFDERLRCYVKQYSAYKTLGKWPINGEKTVNENIADNDGLKLTIKAYYNWAKRNPNEMWLLPGLNFTNEQLVYIGFAQGHCGYTPPQDQYHRKDSRHGDRKFRVIGTLANSIEFANAFNCKINSTMNPIKKCHLYSKDGPLD
ncbi:endothelin-converting enzyme 1-like [Actinia tenebrosa]|uniref:Endothelin-converting enzyme 1-like n=1 Tax=Actinia tenebrosa TaxID=6105 RepID=A0A6P8HK68_ACTTE|nr:endothelin-converting enzyme 1-like [Actinia tenebrosa]